MTIVLIALFSAALLETSGPQPISIPTIEPTCILTPMTINSNEPLRTNARMREHLGTASPHFLDPEIAELRREYQHINKFGDVGSYLMWLEKQVVGLRGTITAIQTGLAEIMKTGDK